jgi:hypothetical protein
MVYDIYIIILYIYTIIFNNIMIKNNIIIYVYLSIYIYIMCMCIYIYMRKNAGNDMGFDGG